MNILVILSAFLMFCSASADEKIPFDVFIESKCPFSKDFVLNGLSPENYWKVRDDIILEFYLCGKSSHRPGPDGEVFECQHGEPECDDNKKITCGCHYLKEDQDTSWEFVRCSMKMEETVEDCAEHFGIDRSKIQECFEGDLGTDLMVKTCDKSRPIITARNGTDIVPDIVLNREYVENENAQCRLSVPTCVEIKKAELAAEKAAENFSEIE